MKRLTLTIAAMALSTTAFADISSGNPDLRGWAVENQGPQSAPQVAAKEASMPFGTEDQYGGILFNESPSESGTGVAPGIGDSYGSVLHSVGFSY